MIDVSIIIVNYNTKELTKACIDSIIEKTKANTYEIIIVDNNSTDGSKELFSKDQRIKFIESPENLGFGKANNIGFKHSLGKYLFLLNSDTLLQNDAISLLYNFAEEHNDVKWGGIGCILKSVDGNRCHSYAKLSSAFDIILSYLIAPYNKAIARRIMGVDSVEEKGDYFEVGYVTGADLFIDRNVIDKCGMFDPDFFMYSEEAELQWRFRRNKYKNVIVKGPQIIHLEGASQVKTQQPSMAKIIMIHKSLFLYVRKTSSILIYYIFQCLFILVRLPFLLLSSYNIQDKLKYFIFLFSNK